MILDILSEAFDYAIVNDFSKIIKVVCNAGSRNFRAKLF